MNRFQESSADVLNNRAARLFGLGQEEAALACWQEALQKEPDHLEANFNYGLVRWQSLSLPQGLVLAPGARPIRDREAREVAAVLQVLREVRALPGYARHPRLLDSWAQIAPRYRRATLRDAWSLRVFEGHKSVVCSVAFSPDGRYALSGSRDNTLRLWELDWEYDFPGWADWDEGARPYLDIFLTLHTPYGPDGLSRVGAPQWTEADFQDLLAELGRRGYGWLRPEGVRRKLEEMARARGWKGVNYKAAASGAGMSWKVIWRERR